MADDSMTFWDDIGTAGGEDFSAEPDGTGVGAVDGLLRSNGIQAGRHERSEARQTYRNGYRERPLHAAGHAGLRVPKAAAKSYFPSFLEPRRLAERALTAVIQETWIGGMSTRKVDGLVQALGMTGITKSQVSALCRDIDERVKSFLEQPLEGEWPCYGWTPPI